MPAAPAITPRQAQEARQQRERDEIRDEALRGEAPGTVGLGAIAATQADLDSHKADTANPHATTAAQVGADASGSASAAYSAAIQRANHTGVQPLSSLSQSGATVGDVPTWNGSAYVPAAPGVGGGGGGCLVQRLVVKLDSEIPTGYTIPVDDSYPQISEGGALGSISVTVTSAGNYLKVWGEFHVGADNAGRITFAVFKDTGPDCSNANDLQLNGAYHTASHILSYVDFAPTAGAQTWFFRFGGAGQTCVINKAGASSLYGASVPISYLFIEEWQP